MADMKEIGRKMRAQRERLGLTQEQVSKRLNVAAATYSRYESGQLTLSAPDMPNVAKALLMKVNDFYEDADTRSEDEIIYEPILDELRAASYSGVLDDDLAEEIAEDIRVKARRRARKQGRA